MHQKHGKNLSVVNAFPNFWLLNTTDRRTQSRETKLLYNLIPVESQ